MGLLLDTHTFLWFAQDSPRLPARVRQQIENEPHIRLSIVSVWELGIKHALGRIDLHDVQFSDFVEKFLQLSGASVLTVSLPHINHSIFLPMHHRDPFDRMIIAQASVERLAIVTQDEWFRQYDCELVW